MKVMIVVTHLLGTGHLARALTLARAFQGSGHNVKVVSGGMAVAHLDRGDVPLVQLPPLRSDGVDFSRLLETSGTLATPALLETRQQLLCDTLHTFAPDVLITELFPFGRRILRAEFGALLRAAQEMTCRPLVCASIRDILAPPSKPEKAVRTDEIIQRFYDAVLVHADADVTPLSLSWPVSERLQPLLHYTGFVAPPAALPHPDALGKGEVIVSAGGGGVGGALFDTALEAARCAPEQRWRILVGGADAATRVADLNRNAPANTIVETARPEFRQMLHHGAASLSMCGYNTALDVLQSGCRAVFVPYDAGQEVEQGIRAEALAGLPGIAVLRSAALNPQSLLSALAQIARDPERSPSATGFDGARQTVEIVTGLRNKMP